MLILIEIIIINFNFKMIFLLESANRYGKIFHSMQIISVSKRWELLFYWSRKERSEIL